MGTDEGLFLLELNKTADSRSLIRVEGVTSVAAMAHLPQLDRILLVVGKQRDFVCFNVSAFRSGRHENPPSVSVASVANVSELYAFTRQCFILSSFLQIHKVTTFDWSTVDGRVYVCAAQADELCVSIIKFDHKKDRFYIQKACLRSLKLRMRIASFELSMCFSHAGHSDLRARTVSVCRI